MKGGVCAAVFLATLVICGAVLACGAAAQTHDPRAAKVDANGNCTEVLVAQEKPTVDPPTTQPPEPPQNPPVTEAKTETDRYTLSHERYEKAEAYSRAGYAAYFLWVCFGLSAARLVLRLCIVV